MKKVPKSIQRSERRLSAQQTTENTYDLTYYLYEGLRRLTWINLLQLSVSVITLVVLIIFIIMFFQEDIEKLIA